MLQGAGEGAVNKYRIWYITVSPPPTPIPCDGDQVVEAEHSAGAMKTLLDNLRNLGFTESRVTYWRKIEE